MIFQEPMTSLNPVFTCGNQIQEAIMLHQKTGKKEAREKTVEMLKLVGIPAPELRVDDYPHQLSGGLRQRVMIAMALSCNPLLLIADEPTTALDVTIQAQILELLERLQNEFKMSVILITHDLGVVAGFADDTAIMYAGEIVEYSDVRNVFKSPLHPYTKGLLKSIPKLNELKKKLFVIPGQVPNPVNYPKGCRFHPRCQYKGDECSESKPELRFMTPDHKVRCFKAEQIN
jgi:oligopeptide/dipeptide ABC transporter ATP-binding protein